MDPVIERFTQLMAVNDHLLGKALNGLTTEQLWTTPVPDANPMFWIAGHVAATRGLLARALGTGKSLRWGKLFAQHTQPDRNADYPPIDEIAAEFKATGGMIAARLGELGEAELSAPAPATFPIPDKTLRGAVAFLTYHEAYHVGQMAYLRKCLGYPGVVDGH